MGWEEDDVYLFDACVLRDFLDADAAILGLIEGFLGRVVVLTTTRDSVNGLTIEHCRILHLDLEEPSDEDFGLAAPRIPGLAFDDRLCIEVSQRRGYICVTNDKRARKELESRGVRHLWGLEILLELVRAGAITKARARKVVLAMQKNSPGHFNEDIVALFMKRLEE